MDRVRPFGFLTQTITIAWYALHGDAAADLKARRRTAPWYRQKTTTSTRHNQHTTNHDRPVTVSSTAA